MRLIYQVRRGSHTQGEYEKIGEYDFEELRSLYLAGVLKDTDLFSIDGKVDWTRIEKLFPKESLADGVKSRFNMMVVIVVVLAIAAIAILGTLDPLLDMFTEIVFWLWHLKT